MKLCTKCGYQYTDDDSFCGNCGNALTDRQQVSPAPPPNYTSYIQPSVYQVMPVKRSSKWKSCLGVVEVIIGFFLIISFCMIPYEMKKAELNTMPEQIAQVEVIKTEIHRNSRGPDDYWVYVEFPDDTEKIFEIDEEYYDIIFEGETGTLFYKERSNKTSVDNRLFIRFEKD